MKCIGHVEQVVLDGQRYGKLYPLVVGFGAGLDGDFLGVMEREIKVSLQGSISSQTVNLAGESSEMILTKSGQSHKFTKRTLAIWASIIPSNRYRLTAETMMRMAATIPVMMAVRCHRFRRRSFILNSEGSPMRSMIKADEVQMGSDGFR